MTTQLSQIKWGRVIITAVAVWALSILTAFIVVTVYAGYLGFQARGAPDQAMITAFADQYAPWVGVISFTLFTLLGAMWLARRVETAVLLHGILLGALASLVGIIIDGVSRSAFIVTILTITAGWLGAQLSSRK
jgi:hypothetical protein